MEENTSELPLTDTAEDRVIEPETEETQPRETDDGRAEDGERENEELKLKEPEENPAESDMPKSEKKQSFLIRVEDLWQAASQRARIISVCVCALLLLALGALITLKIADNYIWKNYSVTVSQRYYDGTVKRTRTLINEAVELEEPEPVEGRVFLGWRNGKGELLSPRAITASVTETYSAEYIVDLDRESRRAYIFPDEYGLYHLEENVTRAEAAVMLYTLLSEHITPTQFYSDVPKSSDCYEAVSEMKTLGVCAGGRYYPEDYLTLGELVEMLSSFYPACEKQRELSYPDADSEYYSAFALAEDKGWIEAAGITEPDPYSQISRGKAILIINAALERSSDCIIPDNCNTGILEYRPGDEMYIPLAQAAVNHTYEMSEDTERWLTSECSAEYNEGIYFIGTRLYYIDAQGHFARDTEIQGFMFGPDGIYTCGDPELDALIEAVIDEYYSPELTREELLRKVFDFTVNSFKYKRRTFYKSGERGYAVEAAKIMLSERTGNCYNYAATFCMLARALGYDAYVCSGVVGRNMDRHGWCEILIDDIPYICDAELMMKKKSLDMYMKTYRQLSGWNYREGDTYHKA